MIKNNNTILVVEDELLIAHSQKLILENAGYNVIIEKNGSDAISLCDNEDNIDLILMDINLENDMDGTEIAKIILQKHDVPLIFLSSHTERDIIEKTEDITSYGYVTKESGETVLLASISMAFRLFEAKKKELEKERQLRYNEKKSRAIYNAISDAIFIHPFVEKGFANFVEVNDSACKKFGYSRDELLSMKASDLSASVLDNDHSGITQNIETKEISFETQIIKKNGDYLPVEISSKVIPLQGQSMILSVVRDIKERKQSENTLLQAKHNYEAIFDGLIDTAWIIDFDGVIIDVNSTAQEVLGYTKEEILRIGLPGIDALHNLEGIQDFTETMPQDQIQMFETAHKKKNGEVFPVEIYSSLINYQGKKAILSVARDITKRKWAEEEIKNQLTEKEYLLKAIHHRVKNNISMIKSLLSLHVKSIKNQEALSILRDAISRIDCMQVLYETLLKSNNYNEISIKMFIESIIDSIMKIFPKNHTIKINRDIDDFAIGQKLIFPLGVIIEELLTNILKYAFLGKNDGIIDIWLKRNGNSALLTVHDNGFGLPDDFSLENTSGFGLMIVRILTKQIDGKFDIVNDSGTKSTLVFDF